MHLDKEISANQNLHYRIKLIDKEGHFEYSQTEEIDFFKQELVFEITEGGKDGITNIKMESNSEDKAELAVFNADGDRVHFENHIIHKGITETQIDLKDLPAGVYFLTIQTPTQISWTERILKL